MKMYTPRAFVPVISSAAVLLFSQSAMAYGEKEVLDFQSSVISPSNMPSSEITQISNTVGDVFSSFRSFLNNAVGPSLAAAVSQGGGTLQSYSTSLTGPITISVNATGLVTASGMSIGINQQIYSSAWIGPLKVGITCNISETFPNASISGTYSAASGTIGSLHFNGSSTPSQSVTCSDDISGIPFLGSYVASQAQKTASQSVQQSLSTGFSALFTATDVNIAIPPATLVVSGIDVGSTMKNSFSSIVTGGGLSLYVAERPLLTGQPPKNPADNTETFTNKVFSLSGSKLPSLSLTYTDTYKVDIANVCPPQGCTGSQN